MHEGSNFFGTGPKLAWAGPFWEKILWLVLPSTRPLVLGQEWQLSGECSMLACSIRALWKHRKQGQRASSGRAASARVVLSVFLVLRYAGTPRTSA